MEGQSNANLLMLLRNKIKSKQQSRKNNFSHESHFRKLKVPEKIINQLVECLKYTNHICPYSNQILKTFKDLSESDIELKVKEIESFLASRHTI